MKLYITRHGQTDWNLEGLFQGQTNIDLNSTGIEQAEMLADKLKDEKIDIIYASTLDRSINTANIINKKHNSKIIITSEIIERSLGDLEGTKYSDYNLPDLWNHILNLEHKEESFYNVEPLGKILDRAYQFLSMLLSKYGNRDVNILICSHGAFIVPLLLVLGKVDPKTPLASVNLENCCCYLIENFNLIKFT